MDLDPVLKGLLPPEYEYIVTEFTQDQVEHFTATLRMKLTSREDADRWVKRFEETSQATFRTSFRKAVKEVLVVCKAGYFCQHGGKKMYTGSRSSKKTGCKASLTIKVRRVARRFQGKDKFMPAYPGEVRIKWWHNHPLDAASALSRRDVRPEVRDVFLELFGLGYTPATAKSEYRMRKELELGPDFPSVSMDRAFFPDTYYLHRLYTQFFKEKYGQNNGHPMTHKEVISKVEALATDGEFTFRTCEIGGELVVGLMLPLMERAHRLLAQSGAAVFLDATEGLDKHGCCVHLLLTHSPVGGLPLGCFLSTSDSPQCLEQGLRLLLEMLPCGSAFYGRGSDGPLVFLISGKSTAEAQALKRVFPQSKQARAAYSILQDWWRLLWNKNSSVKMSDRPLVIMKMKEMLSSGTIEELEEKYETFMIIVRKRTNVLDQLRKVWECRHEWAPPLTRLDLPRDCATNNFSEAAFRTLKRRFEASYRKRFFVDQLVAYLSTVLSRYYSKKILDALKQCEVKEDKSKQENVGGDVGADNCRENKSKELAVGGDQSCVNEEIRPSVGSGDGSMKIDDIGAGEAQHAQEKHSVGCQAGEMDKTTLLSKDDGVLTGTGAKDSSGNVCGCPTVSLVDATAAKFRGDSVSHSYHSGFSETGLADGVDSEANDNIVGEHGANSSDADIREADAGIVMLEVEDRIQKGIQNVQARVSSAGANNVIDADAKVSKANSTCVGNIQANTSHLVDDCDTHNTDFGLPQWKSSSVNRCGDTGLLDTNLSILDNDSGALKSAPALVLEHVPSRSKACQSNFSLEDNECPAWKTVSCSDKVCHLADTNLTILNNKYSTNKTSPVVDIPKADRPAQGNALQTQPTTGPPPQTLAVITHLSDDLFEVAFTGEKKRRLVDLSIGVCTCLIGSRGATCRHQILVRSRLGGVLSLYSPLASEDQRKIYLEVATGSRDERTVPCLTEEEMNLLLELGDLYNGEESGSSPTQRDEARRSQPLKDKAQGSQQKDLAIDSKTESAVLSHLISGDEAGSSQLPRDSANSNKTKRALPNYRTTESKHTKTNPQLADSANYQSSIVTPNSQHLKSKNLAKRPASCLVKTAGKKSAASKQHTRKGRKFPAKKEVVDIKNHTESLFKASPVGCLHPEDDITSTGDPPASIATALVQFDSLTARMKKKLCENPKTLLGPFQRFMTIGARCLESESSLVAALSMFGAGCSVQLEQVSLDSKTESSSFSSSSENSGTFLPQSIKTVPSKVSQGKKSGAGEKPKRSCVKRKLERKEQMLLSNPKISKKDLLFLL